MPLPRDVPAVPGLVWGLSLQRSSCGKRWTGGGTGGRERRGKKDSQALSSAGPASGCCRGPATFCAFLGFNTLQSSGLRAGGPVLILEASHFRRKLPPPPKPHNVGKERNCFTYKGYFQQGMASFPSDHKDALKRSFACLSHNSQVSTQLPCTTLVSKLQDLVGR